MQHCMQGEADEEHASALQRYKLIDARLRRLCERKPSGKLNVPQAVHDQWMAGGKQRDELRALFESYDFDKDSFKKYTCHALLL